jgi:hypothetical protein
MSWLEPSGSATVRNSSSFPDGDHHTVAWASDVRCRDVANAVRHWRSTVWACSEVTTPPLNRTIKRLGCLRVAAVNPAAYSAFPPQSKGSSFTTSAGRGRSAASGLRGCSGLVLQPSSATTSPNMAQARDVVAMMASLSGAFRPDVSGPADTKLCPPSDAEVGTPRRGGTVNTWISSTVLASYCVLHDGCQASPSPAAGLPRWARNRCATTKSVGSAEKKEDHEVIS